MPGTTQITRIIEWDMGHRVPNHKSKCRNPHGHRYRLELTITGDLVNTPGDSAEGMVHDFGDVKQAMVEHIHDVLDHGFMLAEEDHHLIASLQQCNQDFRLIIVPFIPTAERIAQWCFEQLLDVFPASMQISRVRLFETPNSWADYIPNA